jgi:hypothetical protein
MARQDRIALPPRRSSLGLAEIREGVVDALLAAAEEHDRDEDEIICPANVAVVLTRGRYDGEVVDLYLLTAEGYRFKVTVEEAS